ncbi:MAG: exodeoxyribonuclease VII small subunit [Atopobiaceae bacterium]|jgi:exodeoxyribonuclease VII small subunit|nr:exodeoxyribonuclease VII small subunit [Atopobiaceae bacterium]MCH4119180.1 exodeoxyribonuclease VII small subunit [Atopobiaceae bacterium]MCI1318274.1 exodeoxyribonuclease VII small subunit [Atopobiaceae bacterium]MCI1388560.1 exodeoxyribonuclease VII small subunit [Atopobiaceae bacterium]MCI1432059.1 exodeoxyribonuclease VII small subunit [Atopobiaceae bacterium]
MAAEETTERKPVDQLSFAQASIELEQIVRSLEVGDLELEVALERYNRGVELLKSLRERLADAEQKVQVLLGEVDDDQEAPDTKSAPATEFMDE